LGRITEGIASLRDHSDAAPPPNQPFVKILSITGVIVRANPKVDYTSRDVLINRTTLGPVCE